MKKLALTMALLLPLNAMAFNVNIGYPVDAARMSIEGETSFTIDCRERRVEILQSSSVIFDKHIRKKAHVICYKDRGFYTVKFIWAKGKKVYRYDMIASQPGRNTPEVNSLM